MSDVNPWISREIWFEIFKELPVKTLGKCRCVCKDWNSFIVSPSFMAAHLKHYTQNEANSLLLCKEISESKVYEQCVIFRNSVQFTEGNSIHTTSILPYKLKYAWWPCFHLVGSIHGLLCLCDPGDLGVADRILIWNPLLQKSIKLPLSSTDEEVSVLGFGYDDRNNDHRVVKISPSHVKAGATTTTPLIEIYSIQDQTWRKISGDYMVSNSIHNVSSSQCFFNGAIHWLTLESPSGVYPSQAKWALLFNVVEEVFDKMKLPETLVSEISGDFGIFEYQSKLSVSLCDYTFLDIHVSLRCQIWVQGEYNVGSSWCKILNISKYDCSSTGPVQYLGRDNSEELIELVKQSTGEFLSYNRKTMQTNWLGRYGSDSTRFTAYSESLVLLDLQIDALTHDELRRTNDDRDPSKNVQ